MALSDKYVQKLLSLVNSSPRSSSMADALY